MWVWMCVVCVSEGVRVRARVRVCVNAIFNPENRLMWNHMQ